VVDTVVVVVEVVVVLVVDTVVVVVEVVVVLVVDTVVVVVEVVVVVVVLVVVVVVVGSPRSASRSPTQALPSTMSPTAPWFIRGATQSLPDLASSFTKQPFAWSLPPVYLSIAFVRQSSVFGSVGFSGVSAFW